MVSLVHLVALLLYVDAILVDLNGPWTFCFLNKTCHIGSVPGDIFTDLYNQRIIPHPLKGDNSVNIGWVSREQWSYNRTFFLSKDQLIDTTPALIFEGIDTVAKVYLNGKLIIKADNQFRRYIVNVKEELKETNSLEIKFESPVNYAQEKAYKYKHSHNHDLPPVCPPSIYHGECHPNFIRKAQYSFSWDWGPSIPTVGLWKPVKLLLAKRTTPLSLSWTTEKTDTSWIIQGAIEYWNIPGEAKCSASLKDMKSIQFALSGSGKRRIRQQSFQLEIPHEKIELWWPATEGTPQLYNLTVVCEREGEKETLQEEIGFRTVELIQDLIDPVNPQKGRHFYFKINDKPIFLKGSNWIPSSMFPGENVNKRVDFLLDSAVEANMNVLRVWGGGVYESEYFYRLANRKGLLLWQDMMFACALYPTDKRFLATVTEEIDQQIFRLRKHPSILLYAGNNENEVAIRSHWWSPDNYTEEQQVEDYVRLYSDVIGPLVRDIDSSRPFLLSSPSNGIKTEEEGGVAKNPGDVRYGDIHFYNEFINLWQDYVYLTPRCASEYGVQSYPFRETMTKWINQSDWKYTNPTMYHRQHHPGGTATNLLMVYQHFPISTGCTISNLIQCEDLHTFEFMDRFAYFTQAHQAIAYKAQTEHYRRFRGKLTPDGRGNTMCALYWQLNDVWAAPTWSSVDFNLVWKMAHYEAKRFFAPLIVVLYLTENDDLAVSIVNDKDAVLDARLTLYQYGWGSKFEPAFRVTKSLDIPTAGALDIKIKENFLRVYDSDFVIAARLMNTNGSSLAPTAVLLPDKLYESQLWKAGDVSIEEFKKIDDKKYEIYLMATDISPFTWLSLEADIPFWFSDNGFTMVSAKKTVHLHLREVRIVNKEMIRVCNIKNCGRSII